MAKKQVKKTLKTKQENFWQKNKVVIISSTIGALVAWLFGGLELGIAVFLAVWIGNYIGEKLKNK